MVSFSTSSNSLASMLAHKAHRGWLIFCREALGVAQDYWKDGTPPAPPPPLAEPAPKQEKKNERSLFRKASKTDSDNAKPVWHAFAGEVSEKMWGEGCVAPADEYLTSLLIKPLSLTKDMSLLDLSAGLGARLRRTTNDYGVYITGLEPDPAIAGRGMLLSTKAGLAKRAAITAYDPSNFKQTSKYDCVVARELFYRVADKKRFIHDIVACCKHQVQVSFTDYIVNPESANEPAVLAWRAFEQDAQPTSLIEMAEMWAKEGISLRIHDDQTDFYKKEIKSGLVRFARFIASSTAKPDAETRKTIEKRITQWAHRMAALEQGMKFYRFYGLR